MNLNLKAVERMRVLISLASLAGAIFLLLPVAHAGQDAPSESRDIGIIVVPTLDKAQSVATQLQAGSDFAVLAKEVSVDSTAKDGGYMGRLTPVEMPPELRGALNGIAAGHFSAPVKTENGYAILTVFSRVPNLQDLDVKRVIGLINSGGIHKSIDLSGFGETDKVLMQYAKPEGWDRDLHEICELRKQSDQDAIKALQNLLDAVDSGQRQEPPSEILRQRVGLAQLYAGTGQMAESISQLKPAYAMAQTILPENSPVLLKMIGIAYFHLAEMENGVYRSNSGLGIFPPAPSGQHWTKQENAQQAIKYLDQAFKEDSDDYQVRWLLNLTYAGLGEYPAGVPENEVIPASVFQSPETVGRFKDIAAAAGVNPFLEAGGVLVDDFENNGLLDIVTSSMDVCEPLHFYHNNGDGTFTDRAVQAGLADQLGGLNITATDYNNDGCIDILVLRGGWEFPMRKSLLRNNCNGTFTDVTRESGLGDTVTATNSAAWADIDNDGYLDLFIANERSPSQLFRNRGDGTFEDISHSAGIDKTQWSKGVAASDYDNDGYVDFYVSNLDGANLLYHNNHDLTFTDVARLAGVQAPGIGFTTWFFDYDNDGWPDIYVGAYPGFSIDQIVRSYMHLPFQVDTVKLYKNMRNGTFKDITADVNLNKAFLPMGANFGDVDNDGFLDLYLGIGAPSYGSLMPHVMLRNNGGRTFTDITESSGTGDLHKGHGITFVDLFRTGHEDIVANYGGATAGDAHTLRLFHNPGNDNDWINIKLVGVKTNRAAYGARITVKVTNDGGEARSIVRTVGYGSSFGNNPMEQHIGLGHGARIQGLDIWWPASGVRQHFDAIGKDQFIQIKESSSEVVKLVRKPIHVPGEPATAAR